MAFADAISSLLGPSTARRRISIAAFSLASAVSAAALSLLRSTETIAAASQALPANAGSGEAERLFNGRLIAALKVLSDAAGGKSDSREAQCDVLLMAATLSGLAFLARSGRLEALGFTAEEIVDRLEARFAN